MQIINGGRKQLVEDALSAAIAHVIGGPDEATSLQRFREINTRLTTRADLRVVTADDESASPDSTG